MRGKYLAMSRIAFLERLAYPGEAVLILASAGIRTFVAWLLWSAILSGSRREAGGMDLAALVAYYLVASILRTLDRSEGYAWEFAAEIRSGSFSKYLARPVDPARCFLAVSAGRGAWQACLILVLGALAALVLGPGALPDPAGLAWALPILALGLTALALLNFMTSLLAFAFQDITPFHMMKNELVNFLSGTVVPLAMMPPWARAALAFTPFPPLASLPARLWAGEGLAEAPAALATLAAWVLALALASRLALGALSARYEEAGS
ncbi:MAG TPA: ABC-2 family transporter protein [Spirochaetales bacterium]|nr:ABC-2 family transporter protein [Spirochaetales bacterium]HRY53273.1 ABC-2 family transporter protein [Spirochaetia bacterium]HRZ64484.1 ABC-2 family transporter protein [Spirochaetia bacterium]